MLKSLLVAATALCSAMPLGAQSISAVTPDEGSVGTLIRISGQGFGTSKPKVYLTRDGSKQRHMLKVISYGDTGITAEFKKAKPGLHDLSVKPKGNPAGILTATGAFDVRPPQDTVLSLEQVTPGAQITLLGRFFGAKKGKLKVGGKKAKVLSWETGLDPALAAEDQALLDAVSPGGEPFDRAVFLAPQALPNGVYDIRLVNKIGNFAVDQVVEVVDSKYGWPTGGPKLTAMTGGKKFIAAKDSVGYVAGNPTYSGTTLIQGAAHVGYSRVFALRIAYDPSQEGPAVLTGSDVVSAGYAETTSSTTNSWIALPGAMRVEVLENQGGRLRGIFSGQMVRVTGQGQKTLSIGQGQFILDPLGP